MSNLATHITKHRLFPAAGLTLIAIFTALLYSSVSGHVFLAWDDLEYILRNRMLRPLSLQNIIAMFTEADSANWHPITWLSYAINFAIWGESAAALKWVSVIIHLLNSFLIFALTVMFLAIIENPERTQEQLKNAFTDTRFTIPGLIATLLFAIAPQHVESVSWISDRKDILCTLFYLCAFACYIYSQNSSRKKTWNHIILFLFLCSLMSKSVAVTFPVVLIFIDIYILKNVDLSQNKWIVFRDLLKSKFSLILLSGAVSVITLITQSSQIQSVEDFSFASRLVNITTNYFYYFSSIVFPTTVAPYHPILPSVKDPNMFGIIPIAGFIALFTILGYKHRSINKLVVATFAIYSIMVIPSIGVVQLAFAAKADRYAYLPTFMFYVMIGWFLHLYFIKAKARILTSTGITIGTLCFLIYLSATTYQYVGDWTNDESLWKRVKRLYPDTGTIAYINLGNVNYDREDYDQAIEYYKKAIEINPKELHAYRNITNAYLRVKKTDMVLKYYKEIIKNNPDTPKAYEMLGDYYYRNRKYTEADKLYRTMLELDPSNPNALLRNSLLDIVRKDYESALQKIEYYLKLRPYHKKALVLKEKILRETRTKDRENSTSIIEASPDLVNQ